MGRLIAGFLAVALCIAAVPSAIAQDGPKQPGFTYSAALHRIVTGDSVDLDIDLGFYVEIKQQRIHLAGISAAPPGTAEGDAATTFLEKLIGGKALIVVTSRGADSLDRQGSFGNWIGHLYVDGVDVSQAMIAGGHAQPR